jgi:hypothetical protein
MSAGRRWSTTSFDETHPKGASKATFLMRFGFDRARPEVLSDALVEHFLAAPIASTTTDAFGAKRIVCEGPIRGPDGRWPTIRSVWVIEEDQYARLLTLIPRPGAKARSAH